MRVDEHYLKVSAFLCVDEEVDPGVVQRVPRGTAFFSIVQEEDLTVGYVVTAAHNIEAAGDNPLWLRINANDHFDDLPAARDEWYFHDEADVAVTRFAAGGYHLNAVGPSEFVDADYKFRTDSPEVLYFRPTGPDTMGRVSDIAVPVETGDEVFFVGLFAQHYGKQKNLPVARFGRIARMPIEPVRFERPDGSMFEALAYLVESQSWGGYSGSPVFWTRPAVRPVEMDLAALSGGQRRGTAWIGQGDIFLTGFLGLVSGHFDINQPAHTVGDIEGTITTSLNSGIAIVTPAEAIRELLMRDDVCDDRQSEVARIRASLPKTGPTLDSGSERQGGTVAGELGGEQREDGEVSMQSDTGEPPDTQGKE